MAAEQLKAERLAYSMWSELLEQAEACASAFEKAAIAPPERLQRLLGDGNEKNGAAGKEPQQYALIPPIRREHMPVAAQEDWISIPVKECGAQSITLAVLRAGDGPMRSRDVKNKVCDLLSSATDGVVSNVATRLKGSMIRMEKDGWSLIDGERAPILDHDFLWGPPEVFQKPEIAYHRREAIILLLERYPSGLEIVQLVDELRRLGWVKAPINKDLLKEDVQRMLESGKIRRRGNTRKWEVVKEESED
jgi:hypothetical protein